MHWLQFTEGLYVTVSSGAAVGTISAWVDHDCSAYNGALFHMSIWAKMELQMRLASRFG
jgi:hypothetical protein